MEPKVVNTSTAANDIVAQVVSATTKTQINPVPFDKVVDSVNGNNAGGVILAPEKLINSIGELSHGDPVQFRFRLSYSLIFSQHKNYN